MLTYFIFHQRLKKRKDIPKSSLDRVLLATELKLPKIIVPRLPDNTSNVKIECTGKSKQLYSLCDQLLGVSDVNYVIYDCSSERASPGV